MHRDQAGDRKPQLHVRLVHFLVIQGCQRAPHRLPRSTHLLLRRLLHGSDPVVQFLALASFDRHVAELSPNPYVSMKARARRRDRAAVMMLGIVRDHQLARGYETDFPTAARVLATLLADRSPP